jgi:hypothetical protein
MSTVFGSMFLSPGSAGGPTQLEIAEAANHQTELFAIRRRHDQPGERLVLSLAVVAATEELHTVCCRRERATHV